MIINTTYEEIYNEFYNKEGIESELPRNERVYKGTDYSEKIREYRAMKKCSCGSVDLIIRPHQKGGTYKRCLRCEKNYFD